MGDEGLYRVRLVGRGSSSEPHTGRERDAPLLAPLHGLASAAIAIQRSTQWHMPEFTWLRTPAMGTGMCVSSRRHGTAGHKFARPRRSGLWREYDDVDRRCFYIQYLNLCHRYTSTRHEAGHARCGDNSGLGEDACECLRHLSDRILVPVGDELDIVKQLDMQDLLQASVISLVARRMCGCRMRVVQQKTEHSPTLLWITDFDCILSVCQRASPIISHVRADIELHDSPPYDKRVVRPSL